MKFKTKRNWLISVCALFLLCVCLLLTANLFNAGAQKLFKENYLLGETIQVPSQQLNINGNSVDASFYVENPNGKITSDSSVLLNEAGKWKVVYYGKHDGKTVVKEESFDVQIPLTSYTTDGDKAEYKQVNGVDGLVAELSPGNQLTINSVIDLKKVSGKTELISFFVLPNTFGKYDCEVIKVIIEDVYNPNNFIEITIRESVEVPEGVPDDSHAFIKARASTQKYGFGYEKGKKEGRPNGGSNIGDQAYGFYANSSFAGYNFGLDNCSFKLGYDYLTKTLYGWNSGYSFGGNHIIDFNDANFTDSWDGFSSDYVRIKISADRYKSLSANVIITSLNGVAIHNPTVDTTALSGVNVDYGIFDENSYPDAIVNKPYKIFDATADSVYTDQTLNVNVYTGYGSSTMQNVTVTDGYFTPQSAVTHTIVYTSVDGYGYKTQKLVPVQVNLTGESISFNVDDSPITVNAGEIISMPEITDVSGYVGEYVKHAKLVYDNGDEIEIGSASQVKATQIGNAKLVLTVKDYVQSEKRVEIDVTVNASSAPIFANEPSLPLKYIVGAKYPVPTLIAEDYSTGKMQTVVSKVKIYADSLDNEILPSDGYFTASGNVVKLVFEATSESGDTASKTHDVQAVDVITANKLDKSKYFVVENGTVSASRNYVLLSATDTVTAKATFINELYGDNFSFEYYVSNDNFESVTVQIEELDSGKKLFVTIGKMAIGSDNKASISINGGTPVLNIDEYAFSGRNLKLEINKNTFRMTNTQITVNKYADGSEFSGFKGKVRFSVTLNNVTNAEVRLVTLMGQLLIQRNYDMTSPVILKTVENEREVKLGEIIRVSSAVAFDVLNPYTEITLTVKNPDGTYAVSEDGITLNGVLPNREYLVKATKYGEYTASYDAIDGANKKYGTMDTIKCVDKVPPKITVDKTYMSASVNEQVKVPSYTVSDNISATDKITVLVQVINSDGVLSNCAEGKFTPNAVGKWVIRIVALDEGYNISIKEITVNVK